MKRMFKKLYLMFKDMNKGLLILTLVYAILGIFLILSASSITSKLTLGTPYYYFIRQIISFIIVLFASFVILNFFKSRSYYFIGKWGLLILSCYLLFVLFQGFVFKSGNHEVTLNLGFMSLQPAEFIKVLLILYLAGAYYDFSKKEKHYKFDFVLPILPCLIPISFIALSGDKGSAITMMLIVAFMFLFVPTNDKYFKITKILCVFGMICVFLGLKFAYLFIGDYEGDNYILNRLNYVNPCSRYEKESGYQVCNGYIAIDNGGLFGKGIGNSTQKYLYLPASHTDFIFPIIVEELGVIVSSLIIIGYMGIAYNIFLVSTKCYNLRNSLICFGIGIYFLVHIFINLGGVLGLIPLTGIPLPLLSYGGSSLLAMFISFTIVQRICAENNALKRKKEIKKIVG